MAGQKGATLEYTPTWVVAVVTAVIGMMSLVVERFLYFLGKHLKNSNRKSLNDSLQKVKEELMLFGFFSLLLNVLEDSIEKICIPKGWNNIMLPCRKNETMPNKQHFQTSFWSGVNGGTRRLLAGASTSTYCANKGKYPLLSITALHDLHIFIFVLAITHVIQTALTMILAGQKIREWKPWEEAIAKENYNNQGVLKFTNVEENSFIRKRFQGHGRLLGWVESFFKQFFPSVSRSDYTTLRLGFIMRQCKGNPEFNFHRYMVRALEGDFHHFVGISWYLWIVIIIFLLANVSGWNAYFWLSFVPLVLLLLVGTKLEHVITDLATEVVDKHTVIRGDIVVTPSDEHFWIGRPRIVMYMIHLILFQNAFEMAFFFSIWVQYGFTSCSMGNLRDTVIKLIIGVTVQVLCSYSTLPLYAIITQMGSSFKKEIFDEHVQEGLIGWANQARKKRVMGELKGKSSNPSKLKSELSAEIEMQREEGMEEAVLIMGARSHEVQ